VCGSALARACSRFLILVCGSGSCQAELLLPVSNFDRPSRGESDHIEYGHGKLWLG
jgi:hypothetical protein